MKRLFALLILLICVTTTWAQNNLQTCNVTGTLYDANGQLFNGAVITVRKVLKNGSLIRSVPLKYLTGPPSNPPGQFSIPLPRNAVAWIEAPINNFSVTGGTPVQIPDSASAELTTLQGPLLLPNQVAVANPGIVFQDEGSPIVTANMVNFVGPGVNVQNSPAGVALVTISGGGGGADVLNDLSDVTISGPTQGQYLRRDASGWVNSAIQAGDLPSHNHAAADVNSGIFAPGRLGSGTPDNTKVLLGDNTWSVITDGLVPNNITLDNLTQITTRNYSSLQNIPSSFNPSAHAGSHHSGGSDPLALGSLAGNLLSAQHGDLSGVDTTSPRHHWNQIASKPSTFAPTAHATSHQHGGSDEVGTATPGANALVKSGSGGTIADGWLSNVGSPGSCTNCNVTVDAKGRVTSFSSGASSGAPTDSQYLVLAFDDDLSDERRFIAGTGLSGVDGGAGLNYTLNVVDDTTTQRVRASLGGSLVGTRREINFIAGTNVTLDVSDNSGSNRVDVTINSSGGASGYATIQEEGSNITQRGTLNFIGAAATAADNSGSGRTDVTFDGHLNSIAGLSANGALFRTAANTVTPRTITGTSNQVNVANGDGVSGNPVLSLPQNIHTGATPTFAGGTFTGVVTTAGRKITRTASSSSSFNVPVGSHYNAFTANNTAQTATLPDGATAGEGATYIFKDDSGTALAGNKTIARAGSDTIEGGTSYILDTNGRSVTLVWNGTEWKVIR